MSDRVEPAVPKFSLPKPVVFSHHRSGWSCAVNALQPLLRTDGRGILLDVALDIQFGLRVKEGLRNNALPYRKPWAGFVHCPPRVPPWQNQRSSPSYYFRLKAWQQSMHHCRGLWTLSAWMAEWLRKRAGVPVQHLKHPTERPEVRFEWDRFCSNPKPRVIQVGWWLRRVCSIHYLPARRLHKAILLPVNSEFMRRLFYLSLDRERSLCGAPPLEEWDAEVMEYQCAEAYDRLLAENIVFVHLYDSVANNTIVECIVRHTPVLVNPLPSVVEYLGPAYPLYFHTLEEATAKAENRALVHQAHLYLRQLPAEDLSPEHFTRAIAASEFYQKL